MYLNMTTVNIVNLAHHNNLKALKFKIFFLKTPFCTTNVNEFNNIVNIFGIK